MDKLPIKINELSPLIISLVEKIQRLDSPILTKQQKLDTKKELVELVDELRQFFAKALTSVEWNEKIRMFKEKIERAFSQFDWDSNVAVSPCEFSKFSDNGKSLVSSLLKHLGKKGCGILIIEIYLKLCMKIVNDMTNNEDSELSTEKSNFKLLLDSFLLTVNICTKYWHIAFLQNQKSQILLCFLQICKVLSFLLKVIEAQNKDIRKFALSSLRKCLSKVLDEIHCEGNFQPKNCGQEFIMLMDFCLYKLNEISNDSKDFSSFIQKSKETAASLKPMIDEILCYALSISQVTSFENDHLVILSASQRVLRELGVFNTQIEEENGCGAKLNAAGLGEALCALERQVNNAVLRLVLEIFSGVHCPLKNIVNKCRIDIGKSNKTSEDLNILITDFDSEMDKIMQVGFFAVSCTSNVKRILGIQSCLASLESLETELISSLTALYVDCNPKNKSNFQHLIDFWLTEMTELKILIDSVLDPAGFCGIVQGRLQMLYCDLKNEFSSQNSSANKACSIIKDIIRYSRKLIKTLRTGMEDENQPDEKMNEFLNGFQLATQACEAVLEMLSKEGDANKMMSRTIKRCDIVLSTINKLSSHLFEQLNNEESASENDEKSFEDTLVSNIQIPQKNYYKLCDSIDNVSTPNMDILTPYINKGILRSKKRNILYTTPSKEEKKLEDKFDETLLQTIHWDKTPISRKRSRCCKLLNLSLELGNSIDLEITTILENLSCLSNTFSKTMSASYKKEATGKGDTFQKKGKDVGCGMEKDTDLEKRTYTSSGCCARLDLIEDINADDTAKEEKNSVGDKLRNRFLQSLNDLTSNEALLVTEDFKDNEGCSEFDTPDRLNDLKVVEEKINFLKQQIPNILP